MTFLEVGTYAKNAAAALGITGVLWSFYASSGLPVPATLYQVDQKIISVEGNLKQEITKVRDGQKATDINVLVAQRSIIALNKGFLRNEQSQLRRLAEDADVTAKVTLQRRLGQIDDELTKLDRDDQEISRRITDGH